MTTYKINCHFNKCLGCHTCEIACAVQHSHSRELHTAIWEGPATRSRIEIQLLGKLPFPLQCRHCEEPECVKACKSSALYKDEHGFTMLREDRCVGCWMCIMVCPFGAVSQRFFQNRLIASKCDLCHGFQEKACVDACPTKALYFGEQGGEQGVEIR